MFQRSLRLLQLVLPVCLIVLACTASDIQSGFETQDAPYTWTRTPGPEETEGPPPEPTATTGPGEPVPSFEPPTQEPEPVSSPEVQRPGLRVVFVGAGGSLYLYDENMRAVPSLSAFGGIIAVRFSPDGRTIAFTAGADPDFEIRTVPTDGSAEAAARLAGDFPDWQPLLSGGLSPWWFDWVPGGSILAISDFRAAPVRVLDLAGDSVLHDLRSTNEPGGRISPSPDGRWLAVSRPGNVDLVTSDGSELRPGVVPFPQTLSGSDPGYFPAVFWAPDSRQFYVISAPTDPRQVPVLPAAVYRASLDSAAVEIGQLPNATFAFGEPQLSPDGRFAAFLTPAQTLADRLELSILSFDGSAPRILTSGAAGSLTFDWSPEGEKLLFSQSEPGGLFVAEIIGHDVRLTQVSEADQFGPLGWVDAERFVYWEFFEGAWRLLLSDINGILFQLAQGVEAPGVFDSVIVP